MHLINSGHPTSGDEATGDYNKNGTKNPRKRRGG